VTGAPNKKSSRRIQVCLFAARRHVRPSVRSKARYLRAKSSEVERRGRGRGDACSDREECARNDRCVDRRTDHKQTEIARKMMRERGIEIRTEEIKGNDGRTEEQKS
jgi:hypothetical protein